MGKWIDETEHLNSARSQISCIRCASYIDYENGLGWCAIFDRRARDSHPMTSDCQQNGAITLAPSIEADPEHSEYQIGDLIKVIEAEVHHARWTEYTVLDIFENENLHRTQESYLNESRWYYRVQTQHQRRLCLAENQICHAHQSNLISTEEIF